MAKEISQAAIENFKADFISRKDARIAARAAQTNGIFKASQDTQTQIDLNPTFSVEIETGKVADQKASGRCWMFSALNRTLKLRDLNYPKITLTSGTNLKNQIGSLKT